MSELEPYWDIDDLDRIDCENMEREDLEAKHAARLEAAFAETKQYRLRAEVAEEKCAQLQGLCDHLWKLLHQEATHGVPDAITMAEVILLIGRELEGFVSAKTP